MPTNLPPEYYEVEERYRAATSPEEKVVLLEELISTVPKHKGTDHLRADLRRRLAKLKEAAQTRKGASRQTSAFHIEREGAGQVAVIGHTNVGKSALLNALTNASPEVATYPFTTWTPTPGMMLVDNVQIQLIDTPPLNPDFIDPELFNLIRRADLVLLMVDLQGNTIQQLEEATAILEERHIVASHRRDRVAEPRRYTVKPLLVVVNKVDNQALDEDFAALVELLGNEWPLLPLSIANGRYLEQLKQAVYGRLQIMRVYAKPPGKEPDFGAPFVLKQGSTVQDFAGKVHKDFLEHLKTARVWGQGVYDGQLVGRDHVLHDGDVVELRI